MRHLLAGLALVAALAQPAAGQGVVAEVRTWDGQQLSLSEPTFEVFYTIVLPDKQPDAGAAPAAAAGGAMAPVSVSVIGAGGGGPAYGIGGRGTMQASVGGLLPAGPDAIQGRRQQEWLTLVREGVETRVPLSEVAAVVFSRQSLVASPLPPWVAPQAFRHAATAVLNDGSQLQGDYVNLGTSVLRGTSGLAVVDVPWTQIETLRFRR